MKGDKESSYKYEIFTVVERILLQEVQNSTKVRIEIYLKYVCFNLIIYNFFTFYKQQQNKKLVNKT